MCSIGLLIDCSCQRLGICRYCELFRISHIPKTSLHFMFVTLFFALVQGASLVHNSCRLQDLLLIIPSTCHAICIKAE